MCVRACASVCVCVCMRVRVCACTVKHSSPALFNLCLIYNCLSAQTQTHETVWSLDMSECMCVGVVRVLYLDICVYTQNVFYCLDKRVWVYVLRAR